MNLGWPIRGVYASHMGPAKPAPRRTPRRPAARKPPAAKPAEPGQPEPADVAPQPAPPPAPPEETRTCAFCYSRRRLSQLAISGTALVCADWAACSVRAQASGMYAQTESELELATRAAQQGALR
jgi:hypothetical protein